MIDAHAILEVTNGTTRDKALRFRQELIALLRSLEDMHGLPRSVPTKEARERSTSAIEQSRNR